MLRKTPHAQLKTGGSFSQSLYAKSISRIVLVVVLVLVLDVAFIFEDEKNENEQTVWNFRTRSQAAPSLLRRATKDHGASGALLETERAFGQPRPAILPFAQGTGAINGGGIHDEDDWECWAKTQRFIPKSSLAKGRRVLHFKAAELCAVSSVEEHYLDTVGVSGSNPLSRTIANVCRGLTEIRPGVFLARPYPPGTRQAALRGHEHARFCRLLRRPWDG